MNKNSLKEQEIFYKLDKWYQDSIIETDRELWLKINKMITEARKSTSALAEVLLRYEEMMEKNWII